MSHFTYLGILAACLLCVAPLAAGWGSAVFRDLPRLGLCLGTTFVVFTAWDILAIRAGQWWYDAARISGVRLPGRLPLEEALFFVVVPLCVVLTYEAVEKIMCRPAARVDEEGSP